ncbi:packaged DNA stabilization gp4 family protein [Pantoea agglomerans]|uniref:packaged DNA stabilization gp4 family protein n=1 Tax=Enterobacter agglomerans TaxID=549 RepID=UPI003FD1CF2F
MRLQTKGEIVLAALRKATLASNATLTDVEPQSVEDGLEDLDLMLSEWRMGDDHRGIDLDYSFSPAGVAPLPDDLHNLPEFSYNAIITNLAVRMVVDYGSEPSPSLYAKASFGKERIVKWLTRWRTPRLRYSSRMPVGSGNHLTDGPRYFPGARRNGGNSTPDS